MMITKGSTIRPRAFQKYVREPQFLRGPAEKVRLGENERELGKLRWLKLEEAQIDPAPRAEAHGADAGNQHGDQQQNRQPNKRPATSERECGNR